MLKPIFFKRNRVSRVYMGGKLFSDFFGDEPVDGFFPEEWIASSVVALNKNMKTEKDGISICEETDRYFDEILAENPEAMLGSSKKFRVLVKCLDSCIRLPAQVHPDKAFSRKHFNSEYGKTECWTILETRENAKIYFGFKDGVTKEVLAQAIEQSKTDKDAMERLMLSIEPKVGETYLVPARTVHAIGAGCLILEVQEPTDFTIQPEYWCGDYALNNQEMYLGLSKEQAIDCFDFTKAPDTKMSRKNVRKFEGGEIANIVGENDTDCFIINKISLSGGEHTLDIADSYGVYIVTDGEGKLSGDVYEKSLKKGDYFFMPACAMGNYKISGSITCVECF